MDLSSFITSLATSFVIFFVLLLLYAWLSRKKGNEVVYYPNRLLKETESWDGSRGRNPFAWITKAMGASEDEIISMSGVDTATYLVFLATGVGIMILSGIVLVPVLIPIARTDNSIDIQKAKNSSKVPAFTDIDKLAMGNVKESSKRLWAFLIASYWVSFIAYALLWKAYRHVSNLRALGKANAEAKPEDFAILVRDIPTASQGQTRKEQVDSYFRKLHPNSFYRSMVVTDNKQANKIWDELTKYRKKLARAEVVFAESKTRPTNKTGFLGIVGEKVDTINHCNEKIDELVGKLEAEQESTLREKQQAAAIVFFNDRPAAVSASQTLHAQLIDTWTVQEAPEPRQLLWSNLPMNTYMRQIRQLIVYGIVFLTVVFYMIPIAFVSAFTTLENLKKLLPFLEPVLDIQAVKTILEAYLPQIALIVFLALLPKLLMFLSKAEGIPSLSHAIRAASGKYFYFIIFNVFLGVTIGGTLISSMKAIVDEPKDIVNLLGGSLPGSATFFLTFVALKFFVGYGLELSRIVPLILYHLKKKYLCKTEDELKEAWAPGDFGYATRVPNDMLIMTICLCYSVIAPLIIPFGVLYFGLGWLIARNQALNVYVPSYESYGRMWPHMFKRIMAAMVIYQITMLGYFGLKKFYYTPLVIPLPIMSIVFAYICQSRFYRAFYQTPLEVACQRSSKEVPDMQAIFKAFIPPCLSSDKFDDYNKEKLEDVETFMDARSHLRSSSSEALS